MIYIKRITAILLSVFLLLSCFNGILCTVSAATPASVELPVDGTAVQGEFVSAEDVHYYKFTLESAGMIYLDIYNFTDEYKQFGKNYRVSGTIYNEDMTTVEGRIDQIIWSSPDTEDWDDYQLIESGTHYVVLSGNKAYSYSICCKVQSNSDIGEVAKEPNNNFSQAKPITENQAVSGVLSAADVVDFYTFTLEKRQKLTLYKNPYYYGDYSGIGVSHLDVKIYNGSYFGKLSDKNIKYNSRGSIDKDGKKWEESDSYILNAGTYYMSLNYDDMSYEDMYMLKFELSDPEPVLGTVYLDYEHGEFGELSVQPVSSTIELEAGDYIKFKVVDGEVAQWKTDNPKVAKVNKKGKATARSKGYVSITAVLTNGKKLTCSVYVKNNPELHYKDEKVTSITVKKGKSKTIDIEGKASDVKNIYMGNKYVSLTGDPNGYSFKVKGLKKGTSTVKVKVNGKKLKLMVNVK